MTQCMLDVERKVVKMVYSGVILCQLSQPVYPPSQIFLKFHKQIQLFMLIPKNYILLKLVKVSQSYGPYKMTTFVINEA